MTVEKLSQGMSTVLRFMYSIEVQGISPMKLQSSDGNMILDFFPVKASKDADVDSNHYLKVLHFRDNQQSQKCISKKEMQREVDERLALGYNVIGFNTIPAIHNPMWGAC